jgi:multiple sugar transport system ATP-binding protein
VLVGPSGCGKTTVLRTIAGLENPSNGRVFIGDRDVTAIPPHARDVAMVFQNYALYPHKTVRGNLEFGLRMRRTAPAVIAERIGRVAGMLGLERLLDRRPAQLSGGERQRVALGRAIVRQPQAFLLDEPLSNLDAKLRVQTRSELARLHRQLGATMLYVTHDQEEAMTLGDRIAVMRDGRLQQVAAPLEVYRRPGNVFVAGFIGSPAMNVFRCSVSSSDGRPLLESPAFNLPLKLPLTELASRPEVLLGVRPQDTERVEPGQGDAIGTVDCVEPLGSESVVHVRTPGPAGDTLASMVLPAEASVQVGDRIGIRFRRDRIHLFHSESHERLS